MGHTARLMRALLACVGAALVLGLLVAPSNAFAYKEPNDIPGSMCGCHFNYTEDPPSGGVCVDCHGGPSEGASFAEGFTWTDSVGPHGGYMSTTRKCATCHTVHDAPDGGVTLLPASSVYATCLTCHDGTQTGGAGVYGALAARNVVPQGPDGRYPGHRYEATNSIPGGDPTDGGPAPGAFSGDGGALSCSDCHSPHGSDCVTAFIGERRRVRGTDASTVADFSSNRLLRRHPGGSAADVAEYGSDWCLACHAGRDSGLDTVHNHPVESATTYPDPAKRFIYRSLAILDSASATFGTMLGQLGGDDAPAPTGPHDIATGGVVANPTGNRGFLMPWPRTTDPVYGQAGHNPICQQCHEDTRDVGDLAADGSAQAVPFSVAYADSVTWNGTAWVTSITSNPRFQNFPHETENANMLVEQGTDLCTNCHAVAELP